MYVGKNRIVGSMRLCIYEGESGAARVQLVVPGMKRRGRKTPPEQRAHLAAESSSPRAAVIPDARAPCSPHICQGAGALEVVPVVRPVA